MRIREIAESHGIPWSFLVQILLQLKAAGIVESTRGAAGGYQLAKAPDDITLGEVMAVSEGTVPDCVPVEHDSPSTRTLLDTWHAVATAQREMLDGVTFADLAERMAEQVEGMYYI